MVRKRSGVPSGELSDTRRLGSADARWYTSQGEKAVFRRRSIAARNAVKTPGETARGAGARPRCAAPRRTRPEVPSAVTVGAASGAEPSKTSRVAQDCDPKAYMYMSSGRKDARIGHFSWASTVAPTVTARCQANQHSTENLAIPKPRHARRKYQAWSLPMNSQGAFFARSPPRNRMP